MNACMHAYMYTCKHTCMHARTHAYIYVCMHACTHTRAHARTRTHARTHAHTHAGAHIDNASIILSFSTLPSGRGTQTRAAPCRPSTVLPPFEMAPPLHSCALIGAEEPSPIEVSAPVPTRSTGLCELSFRISCAPSQILPRTPAWQRGGRAPMVPSPAESCRAS